MNRPALALVLLLGTAASAQAVVGNAPPLANAGFRPEVMIVGSRDNFCTGVAIAPALVLTAAHCVLPGATYKRISFDARHEPVLHDTLRIERHPEFSIQTLRGHRATADVALVKLSVPVKAPPVPLMGPRGRIAPGERFMLHGYGLAAPGDDTSIGTLRGANLAATGQPGSLQLRLVDPAAGGNRAGLGACTGDSGSPIYQEIGGRLAVIGVVSWSTGPGNEAGCGGLTGVTPLERYRSWIVDTARKLGSPLAP